MRRVATKIFLTFAVPLLAFAIVAVFGIVRLHDLGRDLRLISSGYLPLTRIAAQLEVKDWVASRALEARALGEGARRAYVPVARAHFPALVREKIQEGREVAADALAIAPEEDASFLRAVLTRLDGLAARWSEYDGKARALLDHLERGDGGPHAAAAFDARLAEVRTLEKGLSLDVTLLQVELQRQVGDRVDAAERTERRTVVLIVLYSILALVVGVAAALVSQRLLAPVEVLTEGVKAVAGGDLSRQVDVRSRDELGLLAREFNAMAASLARQQDDLRRAERLAAVGRISAQITHEIRNPLNAIGLNAELLAEELDETEGVSQEARQLVGAITREVDRLNGVSEEYLRFARVPRLTLARQDVNEVLSGLLDFLGPELSAARIAVRRELDPSLPPVKGDEGQLRAVFLNLLRNSREAMAGGGTVTVRTRREGDAVEVDVLDTGGGIPPGDLPRIFDPFYSTKERGTGLGLAFTQQVVNEHGGTIRCESALGQGTSFVIRFPAAPDERASEGTVPDLEAASGT
jgi:two-component system NtrC family sensor kinase